MKKIFLYFLFCVFLPCFMGASVSVGHLFVKISDAMEQTKRGNFAEALPILEDLRSDFNAMQENDSVKGKEFKTSLEIALKNPKIEELEALSSALIEFEREQNPIDYTAKRKQFEKRVMPLFLQLEQETKNQNAEALPQLYKRFYDTWQRNERIVGDTSPGHYGQIETALSLYRVAMVSEPMNFDSLSEQTKKFKTALESFVLGETLEIQSLENAPQTLLAGLKLLREAREEFPHNESKAKDAILTFITQWPIFEGEVRTRDAVLYNRIESELPEIISKGNDAENLKHFSSLIESIESLDVEANYTLFDAAIILLREGLEALLIVMALLAALEATKQNRGRALVIGGAICGIGLSFVVALLLTLLFPLATAGANREILEGAVGIIAVVVMLFVGAWLHSKSSLAGWQSYLSSQMGRALSSGSLAGLFGLSFLAVFREGAETILFYAGMLPKITMSAFLSGIVVAIFILVAIAYFMRIFAKKLPIHLMFMFMSWLLYCIGFKMLGVSVHALQLTNILPADILPFSSMTVIGLYNTTQGIALQGAYVICVVGIVCWHKYFRTLKQFQYNKHCTES